MTTRKTSTMWKYFTMAGSFAAKCNYCEGMISRKGGSTSNLSRHLKARHPEVFRSMCEAKGLRITSAGFTERGKNWQNVGTYLLIKTNNTVVQQSDIFIKSRHVVD